MKNTQRDMDFLYWKKCEHCFCTIWVNHTVCPFCKNELSSDYSRVHKRGEKKEKDVRYLC